MNNELDPTRDHILSKIAGKKSATKKLTDSAESLDLQIEIYDNAIEKTLAKLESQRMRKAQMEESRGRYEEERRTRQAEVDHMEEILSRYDAALAEGEAVGAIITAKIAEDDQKLDPATWTPESGLANDPEYQKALKRKRYLNDLMEACKTDVNKIMVSRGEVSGYNEKGRKGV